MALGGLNNIMLSALFNKDDVEERADLTKDILNEIKSKSLLPVDGKTTTPQIDKQIQLLEDRERVMFEMMRIKGNSIQDCEKILEYRLREYNDMMNSHSLYNQMSSLFGQGLKESFISPLEVQNDIDKKAVQYLYEKTIAKIITQKLGRGGAKRIIRTKGVEHLLVEALNVNKSGTQFSKTATLSGSGIKSADTNLITEDQMRDLQIEIVNAVNSDPKLKAELSPSGKRTSDFKDFAELKASTIKTGFNEVQLNFTLDSTYFSITGKAKKTDYIDKKTKQVIPEKREKLKQINEELIKKIVQSCPNADQNLLEACIRKTIKKDPGALLVGESITQVSGILGEIEAMYAFSQLLGIGKGGGINDVDWIGGLTSEGGKKPHADLVLAGKFGLQVKNTTKNVIESFHVQPITFKDSSLNTFFNEVSWLQPLEIDAIRSAFATEQFNIPYTEEKGEYIKGQSRNNVFEPIASQLQNNVKIAIDLLETLAGALMFMNIDEDISEQNLGASNKTLLYVVGGVFVQTASEILKDIRRQIQTQKYKHFKVAVHYDKEGVFDIVDYYESGGKKGFKKGKQKTAMEMTMGDVILTSSYQFLPGTHYQR